MRIIDRGSPKPFEEFMGHVMNTFQSSICNRKSVDRLHSKKKVQKLAML